MKDVYEEFSKKIVDKYKIAKFKSKVLSDVVPLNMCMAQSACDRFLVNMI